MDQNNQSFQELQHDAVFMEALMCEFYNHALDDHNRLLRNLEAACQAWIKSSPGRAKEAIELIADVSGLYIHLSKNEKFISEKWGYHKELVEHHNKLERQMLDQKMQ